MNATTEALRPVREKLYEAAFSYGHRDETVEVRGTPKDLTVEFPAKVPGGFLDDARDLGYEVTEIWPGMPADPSEEPPSVLVNLTHRIVAMEGET